MENQITDAMQWIKNEIDNTFFGEIGIKFIIHSGQIKRTEKLLIEKEATDIKCKK